MTGIDRGILPPGVAYRGHSKRRPWQARVWYRGRQLSLGYFRYIAEAEGQVNAIRRVIAQWADTPGDPPPLRPLLQRSQARAAARSRRWER